MPAALGQLVVSLSAETAQFTSAMDKAAFQSEKRMAAIRDAASKAGAIIGTALVAGAAGFAVAMKSVIDNADEVGKAAQKLGMTTEALSSLQYAADLSGVSAESLSTGVLRLSKAASEGNKAFAAMGIEVRKQDGTLKDTESLLKEVADKFSGYKDSAEKAAIVQELFGRSGADLIPLLNAGASGIADMQEEAAKLGIVLSNDVTKAAEEVNDNLSRMQTATKGITTQIAAQMLPTFKDMSETMVDFAKNGTAISTVAGMMRTAFETIVVLGSDVAFVFKMTGQEIGGIAAQLGALARGDFKAFTAIGDMMKADAAQARKELDAFQAKILGTAERVKEATGQSGDGKPSAPTIVDAEALEKAAQEAAKQQKRLLEMGIKGEEEAAKRRFEIQNDAYIRQGQLAKAALEERKRLEEKAIASDEAAAIARFEAANDAYIAAGQAAKNKLNEQKNAAAEFGFTMTSAFEDAVIEAKKFRDVLAGVVEDIARMVLRKSVTTPIANAVSGMFTGDGIFANIFGGGRASGGSVKAGSSYLVGEFGPEVVTMGGNGHVTPNSKLGGDTNISITVQSDGSARQEQGNGGMELGRRIEAAVRGVLMAEKRPGGLLAGA